MLTLIRKFPTLTWVENAAPSQVRKVDVKKEAGIPDVMKLMKLKVNIWPGQRVLIAK